MLEFLRVGSEMRASELFTEPAREASPFGVR